jgi:hypothetical protein
LELSLLLITGNCDTYFKRQLTTIIDLVKGILEKAKEGASAAFSDEDSEEAKPATKSSFIGKGRALGAGGSAAADEEQAAEGVRFCLLFFVPSRHY